MTNLLELFELVLVCLMYGIFLKERDSKFILFGAFFFPIAIVWEAFSIGREWIYTTPPGVNYSLFISEGLPLAIPLGWSLSIMVSLWFLSQILSKCKASKFSTVFSFGFGWGLVFELFFVNAGYWVYLRYPQVANLRPSVPVGWGLLILLCYLLYERFCEALERTTNKYNITLMFFLLSFIGAILLIIALKILSVMIIDPFYILIAAF